MSDKKVFIFENNTLFSILSEIKEHLNFDIVELNNKNVKQEYITYKKNKNPQLHLIYYNTVHVVYID